MDYLANSNASQESKQLLANFWPRITKEIQTLTNNDFKNVELPLARIKKIMKLDDDVKMISAEAPIIFAKACEIFIQELTLRSWLHTEENKRRTLQRNDTALAISKYDQFDFLIDIVPRDEIKSNGNSNANVNNNNNRRHNTDNCCTQQQQQQQQHHHQLNNLTTITDINGIQYLIQLPSTSQQQQQQQQQQQHVNGNNISNNNNINNNGNNNSSSTLQSQITIPSNAQIIQLTNANTSMSTSNEVISD